MEPLAHLCSLFIFSVKETLETKPHGPQGPKVQKLSTSMCFGCRVVILFKNKVALKGQSVKHLARPNEYRRLHSTSVGLSDEGAKQLNEKYRAWGAKTRQET